MSLRFYLTLFWRRKWAILITFSCITGTVLVGTFLIKPVYRSSVILRVSTTPAGSIDYLSYDMRYADRVMRTYAIIATSYPLLSDLRQKLNLDELPYIDVEIISESELIQIYVEDTNAIQARDVANALAELLIKYVKTMYHAQLDNPSQIIKNQLDEQLISLDSARAQYQEVLTKKGGDSPEADQARKDLAIQEEIYTRLWQVYEMVRARDSMRENAITIIEPARISNQPIRPNKILNGAMAIFLGLAGGIVSAIVMENIDNSDGKEGKK